ncbi:hypothetical protein [Dongia sp.]|uniref:hypothetical protein n=1 Tax=Dongia sp. TaxID=1977262 RepID=UPI003750E4FC
MLTAASATLLLAACQVPQHQLRTAGAANQPAPAQTDTAQAETAQSTAPDALPKPTPLAATPAVAQSDAILPTALRLSGDPKELLGLDHSALRRVLGKPAQVRRELSAQVWQYVTGDCVVDLYLYDDDAGALKVTYVEARSRSAEPSPTSRCLKSLLERPTASAQ